MSAIVKFNNLDLGILEYRDTWSLSDRQAAQAYGVTQEAARKQRHAGRDGIRRGRALLFKRRISRRQRRNY